MGAGASNTNKTGNVNVDNTVTRLAVVGAFKSGSDTAQPVVKESPNPNRKENIYDFVKSQKESKEQAWKLHNTEEKRRVSLLPEEPQDKGGLYDVTILEEDKIVYNYCGVCGKPTRVTVDGYPCRVCGQTYHRDCVAKCSRYSKQDLTLYDRAKTPIGWSCEHCDNICNLLTEAEVDQLANEFEEFDTNNDARVSLEEYMDFRRQYWEKEESKPMPKEEEDYQRLQFHRLDADGSGIVDYWEFIKDGACKRLGRRSKEELVGLLTHLEKQSARLVYSVLDTDGDGVVCETEAHQAYRTWYKHLDYIAKKGSTGKKKGDKDHEMIPVSFHATQSTNHLLDADENNDRVVTWEEFLRNQALYIISSRPNRTNLT